MIRIARAAPLVTALTAISLAVGAAHAREACVSCAPDDLACNAAATLCQAKLRAFGRYMQELDAGQPRHALPQIYRDVLRAHYPSAVLDQVRFAFSDRQPPDNATTDCRYLYFNDSSYVAALRDAGPNRNWRWLLHELVHAEQCASVGRDQYALRWWSELEAAVLDSGATIDVFQPTEQVVEQVQALFVQVHAAMPMERAADAKADAVLLDLSRCCMTVDGTPVRPAAR